MESFALTDATFDFNLNKHHVFTDEEIKQALQNDLDSQMNSFASMANATSIDYGSFFADEATLTKDPAVETETPASTRENPIPSIESPEGPQETAHSNLLPVDLVASPIQQGPSAPPTSTSIDHAPVSTDPTAEALLPNGLKNPSVDPLLFDFNDQLIAAGNEAICSFEELASMPALASPFQPTKQIGDDFFDFGLQGPEINMMPSRGPGPVTHHLPPHHFPSSRRRSQTAPPDFEQGISFQRRMGNGTPGAHDSPMYACPPQQFMPFQQNNGMRPRPRHTPEPPHMMNVPRSYLITPPTRRPNPMFLHQDHPDFHPPSRPQSLDPDLRLTLMNRGRELSPDRNSSRRPTKRQKQSHDRATTYPGPTPPQEAARVLPPREVDMRAFGVDQAMIGVEFMLKEAVEKVRYGKESEIEKVRSEARAQNSKVRALDAELAAMASKEAPPMEVPKTGAQIRKLNTQGVQALLDFFNIPFVSTMFLHDKKLLYLTFLGASGALKHLVLD